MSSSFTSRAGRLTCLCMAVCALAFTGCGGSSSPSSPSSSPGTSKTPASQSESGGIPQNNGGDQDADNNGGPSDGDGNK
jgi:hypothetical protein